MTNDDKVAGSMYAARGLTQGVKQITSQEQLLAHYGEPAEVGLIMHVNHLPENYQIFIKRSPFLVLGTADKDGMPSTSPKGDAPGFVKIIDDKTLLIPDRIGNNQIDALNNLVENPKISLIFFVPGVRESLRIKGTAIVSTDEALRGQLAVNDKNPLSVIKVSIADAYLHCGKALIRSKLWDPSTHAKKGEVPSMAKMTLELEHVNMEGSVEEWDERAEQIYKDTLY